MKHFLILAIWLIGFAVLIHVHPIGLAIFILALLAVEVVPRLWARHHRKAAAALGNLADRIRRRSSDMTLTPAEFLKQVKKAKVSHETTRRIDETRPY
jgi:ABC-type transport system involved in cytochrome bd biosynthesis fused ATPase/permease subunit